MFPRTEADSRCGCKRFSCAERRTEQPTTLPAGSVARVVEGGRCGERMSVSRGSSRGRMAPRMRFGGRCVGISGVLALVTEILSMLYDF